jgi:hypothetical protein
MARITNWRRVTDGSVTRVKAHYYYNNQSKLDVPFYIREGTRGPGITHYPKLMMVGFKNNKIDRSKVIFSIYCASSWQAKDIIDHIMSLALMIEKNGIPAESLIEWIKMQMQLVDTKLSFDKSDPGRYTYSNTF